METLLQDFKYSFRVLLKELCRSKASDPAEACAVDNQPPRLRHVALEPRSFRCRQVIEVEQDTTPRKHRSLREERPVPDRAHHEIGLS